MAAFAQGKNKMAQDMLQGRALPPVTHITGHPYWAEGNQKLAEDLFKLC